MIKGVAALGVLALLGVASNASAIVITGGPTYTPGGGWSCTTPVAGSEKLAGGATLTCTGTAGAFSNLYIGIKNNNVPLGTVPIGEKMNSSGGSEASGAEIFSWSTETATTIVYTGTTAMSSGGPSPVFTRMTLTFTGTGSVVDDATTQALSNPSGAVHSLWRIAPSVSAMTVNVLIEASTAPGGPWTPARTFFGTTVTHRPGTGSTDVDRSHVDIGFYTSTCGDGTHDTNFSAEQCDQGGANGTAGSCCSSTCTLKPNLTPCTDDGNVCTNDQCNGVSPLCQHPNNSAPCNDGTFCNGADTCSGGTCSIHPGDPCDGTDGDADCSEQCDEGADNCNGNDPDGGGCAGNGTGECSGADTCQSGLCSDNDVTAGTPCTDASPPPAGDCNAAQCNGTGTCDQNFADETAGTSCGDGSDTECTDPDSCDGSGNCDANDATASTPCGDLSDTDCTNPDACDGSGTCEDNHEPNTTVCRAGSAGLECDETEFCDGAGNCPPDGVKAGGTPCRLAAGDCDIQEDCDGSNFDCPTDAFEPPTTVCRIDAGECDVAESCLGIGAGTVAATNCPPDAFEPVNTPCGDGSDTDCTNPDTCDGSGNCQDNHEPNTVVCRAAGVGQECDAVELCDGAGNCPADGVEPNTTVCRADAGDCDIEELCDGVGSDCGPDILEADGTGCGDPSDTDCSDPDTCSSGTCDPNNETAGTECRAASAGQLCDEPEECDGSSPNCPIDAPKAAGVECRAASVGQGCDEAEECDGDSFQCPDDAPKTNGYICRAAAGGCDIQEVCNGSSFDCPSDTIKSFGDICRADAGECDIAETCDGSTTACPADDFVTNGTPCTDDGLHCTGAEECQNGSCVGDGDPCTVGVCDENTDQCLAAGCEAAPLAGCRQAGKSILVIKDNSDNTKDKLVYKWLKGALPSVQGDYADPTDTADYTLCVYTGASPALVAEADVAPGGTCAGVDCWKPISTKGYKFKDKAGAQFGVTKIVLKSNTNAGKSKALVKGKGDNLPDIADAAGHPTVDLDLPVKVQLVNEDNGICWESDFDTADIKKNVPGKFKGKAQ